MKSGETVHQFIIQNGIRSIFSVELINYLNRIINHENLFEIYYDLQSEKNDLKSSSWWPPRRENESKISDFIFHNKFNEEINSKRYKFGLIDNYQFIKTELFKLRNPNFPLCYSKYTYILLRSSVLGCKPRKYDYFMPYRLYYRKTGKLS